MENKLKITAQTNYYKLFLAMMYAVMTTAFFGCQNKEDKQPKNETTEVTTDTAEIKSYSLDKNAIENQKSEKTPLPQPKTNKVKVEKTQEINDFKTENKADFKAEKMSSKKSNVSNESTNVSTTKPSQINAEFPGGIDQFHSFFMKEYKKPESVEYWKLNFTLAFAVEKNGKMSFLECSPAVEEPLEKEIIRILSLCPKWQPAELNGKKIRVQYSVPILLK
ncbi:hypothetical protein [Flavobacterium sp.]|uniref:hypothetical protein n=1 Tax=Flavobacterium sp. TaxID=239 RepID=UPI0031D92B15